MTKADIKRMPLIAMSRKIKADIYREWRKAFGRTIARTLWKQAENEAALLHDQLLYGGWYQ